jgi:hypothetical protein
MQSLRRILVSSGVILILVNAFYFTGVLPPLPLSLTDADVYHLVAKTGAGYEVQAEAKSGGFFRTEVVHHVPGTPLYGYSAVLAPVDLTAPIVHRWERYDDVSHAWETMAAIAFPVSGGRDNGYRGYSEITDAPAGAWRLSIETLNGSVLGRVRFNVEDAVTAPSVYTEVK